MEKIDENEHILLVSSGLTYLKNGSNSKPLLGFLIPVPKKFGVVAYPGIAFQTASLFPLMETQPVSVFSRINVILRTITSSK